VFGCSTAAAGMAAVFDAPSSSPVTSAGMSVTSQWTQPCATGCVSMIASTKDRVPAGASPQERGTEAPVPPSTFTVAKRAGISAPSA